MPCTPLLVSFQNHSILPTNVPSPAFPAFSGSWDNLTGDFQGF